MRALGRAGVVAALPLLAFLVARVPAPDGPEGLFRAGLAALVAAVLVHAFVPLAFRPFLAAAGGSALGVGALHLVSGAPPGAALAAAGLLLGQAAAAAGFAALGRRIGAGAVASGAVSAALLAVALTGLFWADEVAQRLPLEPRFSFRQAVLDLDCATALACDAAGFDRLHHPPVYASVPLASSSHARPTAVRAALVWAVFGILAAGVAALGRGGRCVREDA